MPTTKLTDSAIQRYKVAAGARTLYYDTVAPGLGLRISGKTSRYPDGTKNWIFRYRIFGKQKMITFEPSYPALGLAEAREKAIAAAQAVARREDPDVLRKSSDEQAAYRAANTVESVIGDFMVRYMQRQKGGKPALSTRYIDDTKRMFDGYVLPVWGSRPITSIKRRDVINLLDSIADGTSAIGRDQRDRRRGTRGGPIVANHAHSALSKMFNWYAGRDDEFVSPIVRGMNKPGEEHERERALSDGDVVQVWRGAEAIGYPFGQFYQLCLLIARRRDEVAGMRWDELPLDLDEPGPFGALWTVPGERTKSGRTWSMPLPSLAIAILKHCPRRGVHVFTTRLRRGARLDEAGNDAPISGFSKSKINLDKAIAEIAAKEGVTPPAHWTTHDLRRTATTTMGALGVPKFIRSRILDHAYNDVTSIYDRYDYMTEKRDALEKWGRHLDAILSGTASNVVSLHAAE